MQGKVEICGVNTAHLKTLKNDEMVELLRRSQAGDQAARERLIERISASCCRSSSAFLDAGRTRTTCFRSAASAS